MRKILCMVLLLIAFSLGYLLAVIQMSSCLTSYWNDKPVCLDQLWNIKSSAVKP